MARDAFGGEMVSKDYERGVEQASAIYKEVIRDYVAENNRLRAIAHDMLTAIDYLCQGNECEYCVLACEPFEQCPVDGIRERSRALGIEDNGR